MKVEFWKWIVNYKGCYKVSNLGRIKSVTRLVKNQHGPYQINERILKPESDNDGYLQVQLSKNGKATMRKVHHLVLEAFIGPRPSGAVARHFPDRDPTNNKASNLKWGTVAENREDCRFHGTLVYGECIHNSKLTVGNVIEIKRRIKNGEVQRKIATDFGVNPATITSIKKGETWKHVGEISSTTVPKTRKIKGRIRSKNNSHNRKVRRRKKHHT